MVGMLRFASRENVVRKLERKAVVCSGVKVRRSTRSAPEEKVVGSADARMRARVEVPMRGGSAPAPAPISSLVDVEEKRL